MARDCYKKVSKQAHLTIFKCLKPVSFRGFRPLGPPLGPHQGPYGGSLDPTPIYAPLASL